MTKKALKQLAARIAEQEKILNDSKANPTAIQRAKQEILRLSGSISSLDEIAQLDEMIQDMIGIN